MSGRIDTMPFEKLCQISRDEFGSTPKAREMARTEMAHRLNNLLSTSVEDMHSTLECAESNGQIDLKELQAALVMADVHGYKTKAKILHSFIRRAEKKAEQYRKHKMALQD